MTLPFSGFCHRTIQIAGNARMRVLDVVRAECNRNGVLHGWSQRRIAKAANNMSLRVCHQALHEIEALGIWTLLPRQNRRRPGSIVFHAEHWCCTAEKPAPERPSVSPARNTKSKAREERKNPPVAPAGAGEAALAFSKDGKGEGERRSSRRTAYGQPRAPRRPRAPRQRQRKASLYDAFMEAAARDRPTAAAEPARPALPPPVSIIPPGHRFAAGEVIPMPRQPLPRPRGFSPATDILEAFYYAAAKPEVRDRPEHRDSTRPLLATG